MTDFERECLPFKKRLFSTAHWAHNLLESRTRLFSLNDRIEVIYL